MANVKLGMEKLQKNVGKEQAENIGTSKKSVGEYINKYINNKDSIEYM